MRDAVVDAVDGVVRQVLEAGEDVGVVRQQRCINGRSEATLDQAGRRVTRRRDAVVLPALHERDAVVRVGHWCGVDLAAGLRLERGDPVEDFEAGRLAALRVAGPDDQVELAFALADRAGRGPGRRRSSRRGAGRGRARGGAGRRGRRGCSRAAGGDDCRHCHGSPKFPLEHVSSSQRAPGHSWTRRTCCRFHTSRTGCPCAASTSMDDVVRFCWVTTRSEPASSATI